MSGNSHAIIKAANRQLLLNTIQERGPLSVTDLLHATRLSRPTIEAMLHVLRQEGILEESGVVKAGVGRSARLYSMGTHRHFAIGVDLEFPAVRICAVNLASQCVHAQKHQFAGNEMPAQVLDTLVQLIRSTIAAIPQAEEISLMGVGVGVSGLIDRERRHSIRIERLPGWEDVPLAQKLQNALQLPVHLRNDVHMLALIHHKRRLARGLQHYLYVSVRSGVGMALFLHGKLFGGMQGNAGFFGHTMVDPAGPLCRCGNRGCLETYVAPARLQEQYACLSGESVGYSELLSRLSDGDHQAVEVFRQAYHILGQALSNAIKLTDVQHVVLNGLPACAASQLLTFIQEGVESNTLPEISRHVTLEWEHLTEEEQALGAGVDVIRRFFADPQLVFAPEGL